MLICTIFTALGQLFLKIGSSKLVFDILLILNNLEFILGLGFYAIGALLLISALKYGELSVTYPIISLTFIWVTFLSSYYINETISISKLGGISFILFGVIYLARGGK